jgi:hypothetical protein
MQLPPVYSIIYAAKHSKVEWIGGYKSLHFLIFFTHFFTIYYQMHVIKLPLSAFEFLIQK